VFPTVYYIMLTKR